jgi:KipI family sensor histidine kinase inhibitor
MIDLEPLGDRAFLARCSTELEARQWAEAVRGARIGGVADVAVAYTSAAVYIDPDRADPIDVERWLRKISPVVGGNASSRLIRLPVLYDGDDLHEVAREIGRIEAEVVKLHGSLDYQVFALGFLPGFPYAGYLPEPLAGLARKSSPRPRVPAGSVAIAGRQTGIYPDESPGGWRLIGRTPLVIVDLAREFFPIRPGDRLRFEAIEESEYRERLGEPIGLAE